MKIFNAYLIVTARLVSQDPGDEPALVLLERIRAKRAANPRVRRGRGMTRRVPQEETLL